MNLEQKTLFIAGKFDDNNGRASTIGEIIFNGIGPVNNANCDYYNGGSFAELEHILERVEEYKTIYWFPDIPNDKVKLVKQVKNPNHSRAVGHSLESSNMGFLLPEMGHQNSQQSCGGYTHFSGIKEKNNACILVTSKRNTEGKYSFADLVHHALGNKSNLFVEFTEEDGTYRGRVIDPLGNVFLNYNTDFTLLGKVLAERVSELGHYTRIGSRQVGERKEVPSEEAFFGAIQQHGETFHNLIHAHPDAVNRFFGNASFRCERGFPSFKEGNLIYVSQRNIDKRSISSDGFVALNSSIPVQYYGDRKPSVDSPIQVALYNYYPNVKYMLHGHVYVQNAPFTKNVVPCGALEEAEEIIALFQNPQTVNVAVNLKGHGSLLMVNDVRELENIPYVPRPIPEVHDDYARRIQP